MRNNLTIEQIHEYYPNIKSKQFWAVAEYNEIYNEQLITEFITKTIDLSIVNNELEKRFHGKYTQVITKIGIEQGEWIKFTEIQFKYIKEINQFMLSIGWYPAYISNEQHPYTDDFKSIMRVDDYMLINYLAKYDYKVDISKYKYIYHLSPDVSIDKIKLIGLTPKNKAKLSNNPERIYFLLPTDESSIISTVKSLHSNTKIKDLINSWYLLRINIDKLPGHMQFYDDPMFSIGSGAVWTFQNIPPTCIEIIKKININ